ncbi:MAG: DUF4432 family protein [Chloroflexota bacterium]
MAWENTLHLHPTFFSESEKTLVEIAGLTASTFLYKSGVAGLRLRNELGQVTLLPYQGQQIWHAEFFGRTLTMKSMFDIPNPTTDYLRTYGGFLIHCGATTMGVPTETDDHPLHGDLPNAPYQTAQLLLGEDDQGTYIALTGEYQHTVAFSDNYLARPSVKLYANSAIMPIDITIENLKKTDMDLMYLAHINFRPVNQGQLIYSAPCTPDYVRVRSSIPSHISPPEGYREFLDDLERNPERHNLLSPDLAFDPEVVFYIDYLSDTDGWAHSIQQHPDGTADYIGHRPEELSHGVRWISRTPDQDALGIVLPATAEPEGYTAEKEKGNVRTLEGGSQVTFHMKAGALSPEAATNMQRQVNDILDAKDA